jgi:hypothetical protein
MPDVSNALGSIVVVRALGTHLHLAGMLAILARGRRRPRCAPRHGSTWRYARAVQAEALDVQEQAAAARQRAVVARVRALGVKIEYFVVWTRSEEVQVLSQAASEAARALLMPQSPRTRAS